MKIYAVRDRLIGYFLPPFIGPSDNQVKASLAEMINGEGKHAIQQAPHHFELHRLGEVTEDGHVTESREFLADCSSLIRGGIRATPEYGSAGTNGEALQADGNLQRTAQRHDGGTGPDGAPVGAEAPPKGLKAPS